MQLRTTILLIFAVFMFAAHVSGGEASARRVLVIAHRGAHAEAPENSLAAIKKAIELGCDYVEMDVRQTKDGQLVLMHDRTVNRTTTGAGEVENLTYSEIRQLGVRAGDGKPAGAEKAPSFDEALAVCRGKIKPYVDHKGGSPGEVIAALEKHGMLGDAVIYSSVERLREFKRLRPAIRVMCDHPETLAEMEKLARELKPEMLDGNRMKWSKKQVSDAHRLGSQVWVDVLGPFDNPIGYCMTVNIGVDAMQTDDPETLLKWRDGKL